MKRHLILFTLLLLSSLLRSQNYEWIISHNGSSVDGNVMTLDQDNSLFVVGEFSNTLDVDLGPDVHLLTQATFQRDTYVVKYDEELNLLWALTFGQLGFHVKKMVVGTDGSVYLAGNIDLVDNTIDADPGEGVFELEVEVQHSPFIIKLDAGGEFLWAQNYRGSDDVSLSLLTLDHDGNIYIGGTFSAPTDFDFSEETAQLTNLGIDSYIVKLAPDGTLISAESFSGQGTETIVDVCFGNAGEVYICGNYSTGTTAPDLDPGPGVYIAPFPVNTNVFVVKINSSGDFEWLRTANGDGVQSVFDMEVDAEGSIYTTGRFIATTDFDPGDGEFILECSSGFSDMFIWKLDAAGNLVFANAVGGPGNELGRSIVVTDEGHALVTGNSQNGIDLDPGPAMEELPNAGLWDIFLFDFSPQGDLFNYTTIGNNKMNEGVQLIYDEGYLYLMGWYFDALDADPGPGVYEVPAGLGHQTFIGKYNRCLFSQGGIADLNDSGAVDILDLNLLLSEFGCINNCQYDLNDDEIVGVHDLMLMIYYMNQGCLP